jgi:hypothetical protein
MSYWKLNEDPFYDEDGVLIDEDGDMDWEDVDTEPLPAALFEQTGDPFDTINS